MEKIISIRKAAFLLGFNGGANVLELIRKGDLNGKIENKRYFVIVDEKLNDLLAQKEKIHFKRPRPRLFQSPYYRKRWPRLLNQISR